MRSMRLPSSREYSGHPAADPPGPEEPARSSAQYRHPQSAGATAPRSPCAPRQAAPAARASPYRRFRSISRETFTEAAPHQPGPHPECGSSDRARASHHPRSAAAPASAAALSAGRHSAPSRAGRQGRGVAILHPPTRQCVRLHIMQPRTDCLFRRAHHAAPPRATPTASSTPMDSNASRATVATNRRWGFQT